MIRPGLLGFNVTLASHLACDPEAELGAPRATILYPNDCQPVYIAARYLYIVMRHN